MFETMLPIKPTIVSIVLVLLLLPHASSALGHKDKYQQGYYLDSTNQRVEGLISFDDANCLAFLFKKQLGDKEVEITAAICNGFAVAHRTFAAIDNIDYVVWIRKRPLKRAFAEQVEDGQVHLYKLNLELGKIDQVHKITAITAKVAGNEAGSGYLGKDRIYYFVKRADENNYTRIEKKKSTLQHQLETYLHNDATLVQKINNNKDYSYTNIEAIIHEYNEDMLAAR
jgi:hypothetical protein